MKCFNARSFFDSTLAISFSRFLPLIRSFIQIFCSRMQSHHSLCSLQSLHGVLNSAFEMNLIQKYSFLIEIHSTVNFCAEQISTDSTVVHIYCNSQQGAFLPYIFIAFAWLIGSWFFPMFG